MKSIVYFPKATVLAVLLTATPAICFASPFSKLASAEPAAGTSEVIATAARHKADFPEVPRLSPRELKSDLEIDYRLKPNLPATVAPAQRAVLPHDGLRVGPVFDLRPQPSKEELDRLIDRSMAERFRLQEPTFEKFPRLTDSENYRYNGIGPKLNLQLPPEERYVDLRRRLDRAVTLDLKLGETPFQLSLNTRRCNMRSRVGLCFSLKTD